MFVLCLLTPDFALAAPPAPSSQVLRIAPYQNPFSGHEAFVEFMKTSPFATPAWTDESLHAAFPPKLYARCFDPKSPLVTEVVYESPHGITRGWMIRPNGWDGAKKKFPVVIYNRGGFSTRGRVKHLDLATLCRVALRGYVVLASDFRGIAEVTGKQDRDDLGHGDVLDSYYLLDALKGLYPEMDATNLATWGFSRGTTISVMMATQSQAIKLVILQGTVANCVEHDRRAEFDTYVFPKVVKDWGALPKTRQDDLLAQISPTHIIDQVKHRPTFALFHGGLDRRTSLEDALRFAADLSARKFSVEVHVYPNTGHVLTGRYAEYIREVMRLLDWNLKGDVGSRG